MARYFRRRKFCRFTAEGVEEIDYKDLATLKNYITETGKIERILPLQRNDAHRLIEEFMLIANEAVASHLAAAGIDALYRIHELPDPARVVDFEQLANQFGGREIVTAFVSQRGARKIEQVEDMRGVLVRGVPMDVTDRDGGVV